MKTIWNQSRLHFFTLAFCFVSLNGTTLAELIGHWKFDEGSGTVAADSSTAGNDGQIFEAIWGSDERFSSFLIFDGQNDQVNPGVTLPVMTMTNDFTWAVWVNSQALATSDSQKNASIIGNRVMNDGNDSTPRQFIKLTPQQFEWHQNGNGNDNLDVDDLVMDEWHHIAVVKTGVELEYFFDGISTAAQTLTETIGAEAHPFFIGGQERAVTNNIDLEFFNGFIADVRIYDESLSSEEVLAVFAENAPQSPAELVITDIVRNSNNDIEFTWASVVARTYSLETTTGLNGGDPEDEWIEVVDAIPSGGEMTTFMLRADLFTDLNTESKLFFRIVEEVVVVEE